MWNTDQKSLIEEKQIRFEHLQCESSCGDLSLEETGNYKEGVKPGDQNWKTDSLF